MKGISLVRAGCKDHNKQDIKQASSQSHETSGIPKNEGHLKHLSISN